MALQTWTFATDAGLTYDPALIQVAAGVAELVGGMPANLTFYARYNNIGANFDADFSVGVGTELLAPALTTVQAPIRVYGAGALEDIADAAGPWGLAYAALGNADSAQEGTVEFFMRNSVLPLADAWPKFQCEINEAVGANNRVSITSDSNLGIPPNAIFFDVRDNAGVPTQAVGIWGVVPNDFLWHHYSFGWNINGANGHRVAIDGVMQAGPASFAAVRAGGALDRLWWLRERGADRRFHGYIDELSIYNTRTRNANFVPPAAEINGFPITSPAMVFAPFQPVNFNRFTPVIIPGVSDTSITWAVRMGGLQWYFHVDHWSYEPVATATTAHSCTTEEIISHFRFLYPMGAAQIVAYFNSDGCCTMQLDNLVIDYNGGGPI